MRILAALLPAAITGLILALPLPAVANQADWSSIADRVCQAGSHWSISLEDVDIKEAANEVLGNALGLSFTVDSGVSGRVSFRVQGRMSRDQLFAAFEATLAPQDIVLVRTGQQILVTTRGKARTTAPPPRAAPSGVGYRLEAVTLSYATPSEVVKGLNALGPQGVVVHVDDRLGFILLGGSPQELVNARDIIELFDRSDLQGARIHYRDLNHAPAETVAAEVERIIQASGATGLVVVPLKRLNSLIIIGRSPAAIKDALAWIDRLDTPSREEANTLWLYKAKHTSAEKLAKSLGAVLGVGALDMQSTAPAAGEVGASAASARPADPSGIKVGVDIDSNTLIIAAPASAWVRIQKILNELDAPPDQVLIEATILEVTLSDDFRFGIDWSTIAENGRLTISSTANSNGSVGATYPGLSITFFDDDARAAVTALSSKTNVEVVSRPKLLAINNRSATLQVGDQVPVASQTSRSTSSADAPLVVNTEYRDTGIILRVTPRISGANTVLLEISQEVSSVARTTSSGIDSPTIQQRKLDSSLIIREGQTVAIGGLISTTRTDGATGTPLFQDIPLVGGLFKRTTKDGRRTELIILISATVVRSPADADLAREDILGGMSEVRARGLLSRP